MPPTGFLPILCLALALPAAAAEPPRPAAQRGEPSKLTMKERLSGKASDPQRVNDCKVPLAQRGDRERPAECAKR